MTKTEFIRKTMSERKANPTKAASVILGLEAYRNEFYFEPSGNWPKAEFENRCTARWIIEETIERIHQNPNSDPLTTAHELLLELIRYMCETDIEKRANTFRIASEVLEEIVDYIYAMKGDC